jgi:hypothetical protein
MDWLQVVFIVILNIGIYYILNRINNKTYIDDMNICIKKIEDSIKILQNERLIRDRDNKV